MTFGFSKCPTLVVNRGKVANCTDIALPEGTIEALPISSAYKYLGVLEAGEFRHKEVKSRVIITYKQRLWAILKTNLSGHNQILAVNSFAVPVIRYTGGIINRTAEDCMVLDRLTRKQMTVFKALHDVDRLYVSRKAGGRGLFSIHDTIQLEKSSLLSYIAKSEELIIKQVKQYLMSAVSWNPEVTKSSIVAQHVEQWRSKSLHGQWPCLLQDRNSKSFGWLRTAHLKPVTEALLTAAQDHPLW